MGVEIQVLSAGDGKTFPHKGDKVTVHYVGTLTNGNKFDSSRDRGKPFVFDLGLGRVIRGWDEGVAKMSLGEKSLLTISSDYGYGARGAGGVIPPNATLIFEVELLAIN
jgi:FK506-binding protein 1